MLCSAKDGRSGKDQRQRIAMRAHGEISSRSWRDLAGARPARPRVIDRRENASIVHSSGRHNGRCPLEWTRSGSWMNANVRDAELIAFGTCHALHKLVA